MNNPVFAINEMIEGILNNSSASLSRASLGIQTNTQDRFEKIAHAAGYPLEITTDDYYQQFKRNGLARRVVRAYPVACWKTKPHVYETEESDVATPFEKTWKQLDRRVALCAAMFSADKLCGIGRFGVILIGIDDGLELSEPVKGFDDDIFSTNPGSNTVKHRVTFARAVSERFCRIEKFVNDHNDPRHGLPEQYSIQLGTITETPTDGAEQQLDYQSVHWTRVIHITEETDESAVYAAPRMEAVYNDLLDILKISAGSPEAYWQGALPGLTFKLDPGYEGIDEESLRMQMAEYAENMRKYISTVGVTVNTLSPAVVDPSPHIEQKLKMIAMGTEIPKRMLEGSEEGKLAGEQDGGSFDDKVVARRVNHVEPHIVRRTVEHLQRMGCLEALEEVRVSWSSPMEETEMDAAQTGKVLTEAIALFASSGSETLLSFGDFLHLILKRPIEEVEAILEKLSFDDEPGMLAEMADERAAAAADQQSERDIAQAERLNSEALAAKEAGEKDDE